MSVASDVQESAAFLFQGGAEQQEPVALEGSSSEHSMAVARREAMPASWEIASWNSSRERILW